MSDTPPRILVVDDDPENVALITDLCGMLGYTVRTALDGATGLEKAFEDAPDLVLLDLSMPEMDGFEVLRRLKADERTAEVPVIAVTALTDIDSKVRSIEAGADDYLTKPFKLFELQTRINTALQVRRYQDRLRSAERALAERTGSDPVTGAGQYVHLHAQLDYEVTRARRYGRPLSALLVSVDDYIELSERHGRETGDAVLHTLAEGIEACTRRIDRLFRMDVEEFVVLLPETPLAGAVVAAERIRAHVHGLDTAAGRVTVSIGIAAFPTSDVRGGEDLLKAADEALRTARTAGPGHVAQYGD